MDIREQKLVAAISYLTNKTKNIGRTKLFKLLYFADFLHFKNHGLSLTGFEYYTYPFGPVPKKLYENIINDKLSKTFNEHISIIEDDSMDDDKTEFKKFKVVLKSKKMDLNWLTPHELKTLEEVAFTFKDATAAQMVEITHLKNTPWNKTLKTKGEFHPIDYFLAIDDDSLNIEIIKERFRLQAELNGGIQ